MLLSAALEEAKKREVDLVEIAPKAQPPVCKLIDFKKFKYIEAKKEAEEKKKSKKVEIKEVRFSPFIAENDFNIRLEKIRGFLKENDKVRMVVRFRGRQMMKKDFGYRLIQQATEKLQKEAAVDLAPRIMGNILEAVIRPIKKGKNG